MIHFNRNIREHSDIDRICHVDTASDTTCNIDILDHRDIKVTVRKHGADCRENSSFRTDKAVDIHFCDFYIFARSCFFAFKCQHIAAHSVCIAFHAAAFSDKFSFWIDDLAAEQLTDNINDTGTADTNRFCAFIANDRQLRLHRFCIYRTCLDRTVGRSHTAADISALKGWSCRTCTAEHKV